MELRKKVSNLLDNVKPIAKPSLKVAVVTTFAVSPFLFSKSSITLANDSKLSMAKSRFGVASKKNMRRITNSNSQIYLPSKLNTAYISEKVHPFPANHFPSITNFNSEDVTLNASAIIIDGKPVAYVRNREAAEQVVRKLELNFVTENELNKFDAMKSSLMDSFSPLKENESRLLDIHLSKNIVLQEANVSPDKIMPIENAVALLLKGANQEIKYRVQEGDVLGRIANNNGLKLAELLKLNPQLTEKSLLMPGQEITITEPEPYVEVIVEKEVSQKETIPYSEEVINDPNLVKGESRVSQQGLAGVESVSYYETIENGKTVMKELTKKVILGQPIKQIVIKGSKVAPSRGEGIFIWPADGGYISSQMGYRWGRLHKGIDIARPSDYTIKAADNGIVISAGWDGSYGNKIVIDHQNGFQTVYAHLSSIRVGVGETVQEGSPIGIMGETGDATGIHLHFEVYKNGILKNPLQYLRR
ncbi:MAG: M23 family metallopeptidase [Bacillota bacterium]|nr:M23 family metallopeptidase [Bacillota bacterium]